MKNKSQASSHTKTGKKKNRENLQFNEAKRAEFLGGFHKRKLQRKKKAQEQLKEQLKIEKKRIKQDAKEKYKKMFSYREVPEIEEFNQQLEFEMAGRKVSILELNIEDLEKRTEKIGTNTVSYEDDGDKEEQDEEEKDDTTKNSLSGLVLNDKIKKKLETSKRKKEPKNIIKRAINRSSLKHMKHSKAFKTEKNVERNKNKKEARKKMKHNQPSKDKKKNKKIGKKRLKK